MSKFFPAITISLVISFCVPVWAVSYSGGNGSEGNPYQIHLAADWQTLMLNPADWGSHFVLTENINMAGVTSVPVGNVNTPFTGVFDGNGHTISNAVINLPDSDYVGLFGLIGSGGRVSNMGVVNIRIEGYFFVGALAGGNQGSITSCYATGIVNSPQTPYYSHSHAGGLVGYNDSGSITSCYAATMVTGNTIIGGLAGSDRFGTIDSCYSTGQVNGFGHVGGLVGENYDSLILSCFWDMQTSDRIGSHGGKGLSTGQMKTITVFQNAQWAGKGWVIQDGMDYPRLDWENAGGDAIPSVMIPFVGSGTVTDPYLITTSEDFSKLSWYSGVLDQHIKLTADLDLSTKTLYPIGDLGEFSGVFDGDNHVVHKAVIHQPESDNAGLFGYINSGGQIKNLGVADVNVLGSANVGGLAGNIYEAQITGCYVTGNVRGDSCAGGLVGRTFESTLHTCHSLAAVDAFFSAGGLIGYNCESTVSLCYATGDVSGVMIAGGLAGFNSRSAITSCYATGSVGSGGEVGGLAGVNDSGWITSCYAMGSVTGGSLVGGLIGNDRGVYPGTIAYCYSTGFINGSGEDPNYVGGLLGVSSSFLTSCFWDIQTSGTATSNGGAGLSTAQMMQRISFDGWDFTDTDGNPAIWMMLRPGEDYPRLAWQTIYTGDIAGLYGVNWVDFAELARHWLNEGCPVNCENADIDGDGIVGITDFVIIIDEWLEGI